MARGGRRTPADPAPVSGPGALSRRTDGGAGQPVRSFPAQSYGQRQRLSNLQSAAPMEAGASPSSAPAPSGGGGLPPEMMNGILGPTRRPSEPVNAGLGEPRIFPRDPDMLLRAIYQQYPHPDIARLLPEAP